MALTSLPLTVIIIAGNASDTIRKCIQSVKFCPHLVVVAANSTDDTVDIIRSLRPDTKFIETRDEYNKHFSKWRNLGFKAASTPWVFYLDTDEAVTPKLQSEIISFIKTSPPQNAVIPRANHFLGLRVSHGGTYPDYVKRIYHRSVFQGYRGILHEEPIVQGSFYHFHNDLLHFTHRNLGEMLSKSIAWTAMEAQNLFEHHHPPMKFWRIPRMMFTKFIQRYFKQQMYRDGTVGLISSTFETFDTFMIYANLWEIQKKSNFKK